MTQRPHPPFALAALLVVAGCGDARGKEAGSGFGHQLRRREAVRVRTAPVVAREMVRTISTTTTVESENEIEVFPRVSGVVTELRAEEGDRVAAGDVLAVLDNREAKSALADAEAALKVAKEAVPRLELGVREALERAERAKLAWEQSKREVERNVNAALLSEVEIDKLRLARDTNERDYEALKIAHEGAQCDLENQATVIERAELTVRRQELELSYTEITAPFAGVIAERSIKVGNTVTAGAAAFTLTDPDRLRAVVYRPQRELPFFLAARNPEASSTDGTGIEIRVFPEALPEQEFAGTIRFLSPTIDPSSGSFRLTIDLDQTGATAPGARLLPGMLVRLEIVTERHPDALVVPKRALRREGDTHSLFVLRDGRAVQVAVEEGFSDDEDVEILTSGGVELALGEPVVVVGNRDLEDGEEVQADTGAPANEGEGGAGDEVAEQESATEDSTQAASGSEAAGKGSASGSDGGL